MAKLGPPTRQRIAPRSVHKGDDDEPSGWPGLKANHSPAADLSMIERWMRASPERDRAKCTARYPATPVRTMTVSPNARSEESPLRIPEAESTGLTIGLIAVAWQAP